MAAAQQVIADTIIKLKRRLEEESDGSESDDSIAYNSNRGRKLKRRAKWVHEGVLDDRKGRNGYKEEIKYFGTRKIISRKQTRRRKKPPFDSDESSESSGSESGDASDTADPYEDIHIDKILAPLHSAADLPSHPSMSHPYTSKTLNNLIHQSLDKISEEYIHMTKLKNLWARFLGDDQFINMEKMKWPEQDYEALAREHREAILKDLGGLVGDINASGSGSATNGDSSRLGLVNGNSRSGCEANDGDDLEMGDVNGHVDTAPEQDLTAIHEEAEGSTSTLRDPPRHIGESLPGEDANVKSELAPEDENAIGQDPHSSVPMARRMTTRSAFHNHTSPSPAPDSPAAEVDPWFFPPDFKVDRDFGIPAPEAEETRRLLGFAVHKQEEFMRGLQRLQHGLLKTERLRKLVWSWCRAMEGMREEQHRIAAETGVMPKWNIEEAQGVHLSDGEDWYDQLEWGLDGPLEKGREEEDEGIELPANKKTRRRNER